MKSRVHEFENGIRVFEHHLIDVQRERYKAHNVHEAEEEALFLEVLDALDRGATFVNVGAAIGYYVILAATRRLDLKVSAYEPLRIHRRRLKRNARLNGLPGSRIEVFSEAVGDHRGNASFEVLDFSSMVTADSRTSGWLVALRERYNNTRIRMIPLDDVVARAGGSISLLQMDIQGLEENVLTASNEVLNSGKIQQMLIGTHSIKIHNNICNLLERANYRIVISIPDPQSQPDGIIHARRG